MKMEKVVDVTCPGCGAATCAVLDESPTRPFPYRIVQHILPDIDMECDRSGNDLLFIPEEAAPATEDIVLTKVQYHALQNI